MGRSASGETAADALGAARKREHGRFERRRRAERNRAISQGGGGACADERACSGARCLDLGEQTLIAGCANGWVVWCDLRSGRFERKFAHNDCVNTLHVQGDMLVTAGDDGLVKLSVDVLRILKRLTDGDDEVSRQRRRTPPRPPPPRERATRARARVRLACCCSSETGRPAK